MRWIARRQIMSQDFSHATILDWRYTAQYIVVVELAIFFPPPRNSSKFVDYMSQFLFTFLFLFPLTLLRPPISPPRDCWLSWELRSSEALLLRRAAWASGKLCKIKKYNFNPKYSKHAGIGCKWIIIVYCTCTNSSKYFSVVPCTKVSVLVSRGEGGLLFWSREILDWISVGNWNTLKFNLWNSATFDFLIWTP